MVFDGHLFGDRSIQWPDALGLALLPAMILARGGAASNATVRIQALMRSLRTVVQTTRRVAAEATGALFSLIGLGSLLGVLLVGQIVEPGFTDYWGYMVFQIAATIVAIVWLSNRFAAEGGLSWPTHLIVVATTYVDIFGTAAHMYERHVTYDKVAHFGGGAALAAASYDILYALNQRGALSWPAGTRAAVAISVATLLGSCWELYEFTADVLFHTYRHAGALDTIYDLISDFTGALVTSAVLIRWEGTVREPDRQRVLDVREPS